MTPLLSRGEVLGWMQIRVSEFIIGMITECQMTCSFLQFSIIVIIGRFIVMYYPWRVESEVPNHYFFRITVTVYGILCDAGQSDSQCLHSLNMRSFTFI